LSLVHALTAPGVDLKSGSILDATGARLV